MELERHERGRHERTGGHERERYDSDERNNQIKEISKEIRKSRKRESKIREKIMNEERRRQEQFHKIEEMKIFKFYILFYENS